MSEIMSNEEPVKFEIGQIVYSKVDPDVAGMVTGIMFRPTCVLIYVTWPGGNEINHYQIELTADRAFSNTN